MHSTIRNQQFHQIYEKSRQNVDICRKPDHVHLLVHRLELASHPVGKTLCWSRHLERQRRLFGGGAVGGERVGDLGGT